MHDYLENPSSGTWYHVEDFLTYGEWRPEGDVIMSDSLIGASQLDRFSSNKFLLNVHLISPKYLDLQNTGKRYSKNIVNPYVYIAKSGLPNAGLGLFASKTFKKKEIISVYIGKKLMGPTEDTNTSYVEIGDHIVDPLYDNKAPYFYWGAHIANDAIYKPENEAPTKREFKRPKKNNAKFKGLFLTAKVEIRPRQEIFAFYDLKKFKVPTNFAQV